MGTSAGSKGSPSGAPLIPDWVPDVSPLPAPPEKKPIEDPKKEDSKKDDSKRPEKEKGTAPPKEAEKPKPDRNVTEAPRARYGTTRSAIGKFSGTGSRDSLKSALGRFASKGAGGAGNAARRLGASSAAAGRAYGVLSALRSNTPDKSGLAPSDLKNCTKSEAKDRIIEAIQPVDGSQDTEAIRESLNQAFSEILEIHDDADLTNLTNEQFDALMSSFIAHEIHSHFLREVGETLFARAGVDGVERSNEVLDYIKAEVGRVYASFETRPSNERQAAGISNSVLEKTYKIFEGYVL